MSMENLLKASLDRVYRGYRNGRARLRLVNLSNPTRWVEVTEAIGLIARMRGLRGSPEPGAGRGLLLKTRQVHSFGLEYPIDAVYIGKKGRVLRVDTIPPARIGPLIFKAQYVLELRAGEAARMGIHPGGTLVTRRD